MYYMKYCVYLHLSTIEKFYGFVEKEKVFQTTFTFDIAIHMLQRKISYQSQYLTVCFIWASFN